MQILLNNCPQQIAANTTVFEMLQQHRLATEGLAVAVNNNVIAKRLWSVHQLQSNDCVNLFHIVTGG